MPTIVLVRPGSTDFDEQNRVQGTLDLPLNQAGEGQVARIAEELSHAEISVVYTSPNEPARSTAEAIGNRLGVKIKACEDLRNLNYGLWQGMQLDEIRHKYPRVFKQWKASPETVRPPEGELVAEAVARIERALHKPLKKKLSFAVVASEPLATLVSCVLRKTKPAFSESLRPNQHRALVEYIELVEPGANSRNGQGNSSPQPARPRMLGGR